MDCFLVTASRDDAQQGSLTRRAILAEQTDQAKASPVWLDITSRIKAGDTNAFADFYRSCFDVMYSEIRRCTGCDESGSLDLVHDAMIKAMRSIKPLPSLNAVQAWSRIVARSVAYDWLRIRAKRNRAVNLDGGEAVAVEVENELREDDLARLLWVEEQLKTLPLELQSLISLRYRVGLSLKQIGKKMGLTTGAVDGRIRRAMERLKAQAEREFGEPDE